jgi:hypothetical protein
MFFGWKKRCRHLEAENARLKAHSAQLEARLTESQAKNQRNRSRLKRIILEELLSVVE